MIFVYLAQLHDVPEQEALYPPARAEEILSCANAAVRAQKASVWKLLRLGLRHADGSDMRQIGFGKTDCGKWVCDRCCFSLSHTKEGVAVALSHAPVGIDREELSEKRFTRKLYDRIACAEERAVWGETPSASYIARLWTAKESLFKQEGGKVFRPEHINTEREEYASFCMDGAVISVTGRREELRVFRYDGAAFTQAELPES